MPLALPPVLPFPDTLAIGSFLPCWIGYTYHAGRRRRAAPPVQFRASLRRLGADARGKDAPDRADFAPRPAMLATRAVSSFNRGMRAHFLGLAALSWFIQPWALATPADPIAEKGDRHGA